MNNKENFAKIFPQYAKHEEKLSTFVDILREKNKIVNLTAITEVDDVWSKHIFDSLMLSRFLEENQRIEEVADVGTGGGFPGLPLAVCFESKNFTLIDSTRKKVDAVGEFIDILGLSNARVEWARSQELARNFAFKNQFDLVVARAVAYLPELMDSTFSLVKNGGYFAFYKVLNDLEFNEGESMSRKLGLVFQSKIDYKLENENFQRSILIYKKN